MTKGKSAPTYLEPKAEDSPNLASYSGNQDFIHGRTEFNQGGVEYDLDELIPELPQRPGVRRPDTRNHNPDSPFNPY